MPIYRTDPDIPELGFAINCVCSGSITFNEFLEWSYKIIMEKDNLDTYFYDIPSTSNLSEAMKIIGFRPECDLTNAEGDALYGISVKRGIGTSKTAPDLAVMSNEAALKALADNPHIEQRFRDTFPFIDF